MAGCHRVPWRRKDASKWPREGHSGPGPSFSSIRGRVDDEPAQAQEGWRGFENRPCAPEKKGKKNCADVCVGSAQPAPGTGCLLIRTIFLDWVWPARSPLDAGTFRRANRLDRLVVFYFGMWFGCNTWSLRALSDGARCLTPTWRATCWGRPWRRGFYGRGINTGFAPAVPAANAALVLGEALHDPGVSGSDCCACYIIARPKPYLIRSLGFAALTKPAAYRISLSVLRCCVC